MPVSSSSSISAYRYSAFVPKAMNSPSSENRIAVDVFWSSESSHGLKTSILGLEPGSSNLGAIPYLDEHRQRQSVSGLDWYKKKG